jgi:hypothetical protein
VLAMDLVVASYTPTLATLDRVRTAPRAVAPRLLVVGLENTRGYRTCRRSLARWTC